MKRYKTVVPSTAIFAEGNSRLRYDLPVAIYYRQSIMALVGNISTDIQTIDMVVVLKGRGWAEDKIILIDADKGISGQTKIDERVGMSQLFGLIVGNRIGTVACQDEDRLFRDVTQIQVNIFIDACKTHGVKVLTPSMVYDFAHPDYGQFHARQFRFKCEMAAEYITSHIRGRLNKARDRMLMQGLWGGAAVPYGFMVDMRKTLPDGGWNPNWRKYVPFEPYADIMREYFAIFRKCGGNLHTTFLHIYKNGPFYPQPMVNPPYGFKVSYRKSRIHCPTRNGLRTMLTNAVYIGHWTLRRSVVHWNNHAAIVPEDLFMFAFNVLSSTNFDGTANEHYKPICNIVRPSLDSKRPEERPLFAGIVRSPVKGTYVGTRWETLLGHYVYYSMKEPEGIFAWSKKASQIDDAVSQLLQEKLVATFEDAQWQATIDDFVKELGQTNKVRLSQISALDETIEGFIQSLSVLKNPDLIAQIETRYEQAKAEKERLLKLDASEKANQLQMEALQRLRQQGVSAIKNWSAQSRDERRVVANTFIDHIDVVPLDDHGNVEMTIVWRDGSSDMQIVRRTGRGVGWLKEELDLLRSLYNAGTGQVEIARHFPERTWKSIAHQLANVSGGQYRVGRCIIKPNQTYRQYAPTNMGSEEGSGS